MYTALKLTNAQDLQVPPDTLLKHLESSLANFENLLKELNCNPEDLHQTLHDPQTEELLKLKLHVATMQLKLIAVNYIPHALLKLVHLMNTSEKPEVARRAATTVLNIAGIATNTKPEIPTPPTPQAQKEKDTKQIPPPTPEDEELFEDLALMMRLKHHGFDLHDLPKEKIPEFMEYLTNPPQPGTEYPPPEE